MSNDIEQPDYESMRGPDKSHRKTRQTQQQSIRKLRNLDFDPIEKLVELYHKLLAEERIHFNIRAGTYIQLDEDGRSRSLKRYSAVAHANILSQIEKIASELMRYKYGRVPEKIEVEHRDYQGLTINLSEDMVSYKRLTEGEDGSDGD